MLHKQSRETQRNLSDPAQKSFCQDQAEKLAFADAPGLNLDEKVAFLPHQALRFLFTNQMGVVPFETESSEQLSQY